MQRSFSIACLIVTSLYQHAYTQALYWSCIELITDACPSRLHEGKVPNALWMITCTHSTDYNCFNPSFNLGKVFIKIYSTDISIATLYLYCFWILRVLLPTHHTLIRHLLVVSFSQFFPFPRQNH